MPETVKNKVLFSRRFHMTLCSAYPPSRVLLRAGGPPLQHAWVRLFFSCRTLVTGRRSASSRLRLRSERVTLSTAVQRGQVY